MAENLVLNGGRRSKLHLPGNRIVVPRLGTSGLAGGLGSYMESFNEAIGEAEHDWPIYLDRLRDDVNAEIGPSVALVRNAIAFFSSIDTSSQESIINSVAALLGSLGPVGAYASEALKAIQAFADYVTSSMPAFTLQIQNQHTAHLDWWLGEQLLGFTNPDAEKAIEYQRLAGWAETIFSLDYQDSAWCMRSTPYLGSMRPTPTTLEQALERFRWIAGPRAEPIRQCTNFSMDYPSWSATAEGRASIPVADRIASSLSGDSWTARTLRAGACKVWQSEGLILVFNMDQDINPGSSSYYVPLSGIKVNIGFLPDEMLSMLGTYYSLTFQLMNVLGGRLAREDIDRIKRASFGPELQGLKKYNLLRLLIMGDMSVGLGGLAEVGHRFGTPRREIRTATVIRPEKQIVKKASPEGWTTGEKVAVAGGGAAALALLTKLLKVW